MSGDGTWCVRGGAPAPGTRVVGSPVHDGPVLTTAFHLGLPHDESSGTDFYARADNPTWRELEAAIGALDGGPCTVFGSGMAAIAAVLRACTTADRGVLMPSDGYYVARVLADEELAPLGIDVRQCATAGDWHDAVAAGPPPGLVLLETPSNPGLEVCDIAEVAEAAHAVGALLAVDNTTATPLGQRPLDLGADIVVASDTKALAGHGDVLLGHVSTADPVLAEKLRAARTRGGAVPGPMEAWLVLRGLGTLDLRLARQAQNARALAVAIREHPAARDVRWPGLADDPSHRLASVQMRRWNGILRFTLGSEHAVGEFLAATTMVDSATSFGSLRTSADRRARWGDAVPPGLVRLSAGCEDTDDLVDDVLRGLDAVAR
ncbi:cystathionine gamma-lyase [Pseudonocardia endophytica]|uniref:Cystathionine gamma-lyase n=1 Tax=Pseudonocardia endophytica TaxID=401976 RepID=A0A4R1HK39_PSEEN|nr:cystathionine gamma-lyase [Pseudonocardia endophytica]TCK20875.1 cystathionine gamma-lyase [Pseudonocardia endophytica]